MRLHGVSRGTTGPHIPVQVSTNDCGHPLRVKFGAISTFSRMQMVR
jgi:hypothetical protein